MLWARTQPGAGIDTGDWYLAVFPVLAIVSAYRVIRPKQPLIVSSEGLTVSTGLPFIGLKTTFPWRSVRRLRITAAGLLLIELKDPEGFAETRPGLVAANIRANQRRLGAAAGVALKELDISEAELATLLRGASGVRVSTPERSTP